MSTMQGFYQVLNTASETKDVYMNKLAALSKIDRKELSDLVSKIEWQTWITESSAKTAKA